VLEKKRSYLTIQYEYKMWIDRRKIEEKRYNMIKERLDYELRLAYTKWRVLEFSANFNRGQKNLITVARARDLLMLFRRKRNIYGKCITFYMIPSASRNILTNRRNTRSIILSLIRRHWREKAKAMIFRGKTRRKKIRKKSRCDNRRAMNYFSKNIISFLKSALGSL